MAGLKIEIPVNRIAVVYEKDGKAMSGSMDLPEGWEKDPRIAVDTAITLLKLAAKAANL